MYGNRGSYHLPFFILQERYNTALTKTRIILERKIGQLKRRFNCLHGEKCLEPTRAGRVITACVILFNISKDFGVLMDEHADPDEAVQPNQDVKAVTIEGHAIRDTLVQTFFS